MSVVVFGGGSRPRQAAGAALLALTVAATAAGCSGGGSSTSTSLVPATVGPDPTTTSTAPLPPGAVRTATGAGGAPMDDRIGPPGNDRPVTDPQGEGDCYNETLEAPTNQTAMLRVLNVACELPHDAEVVGVYALADTAVAGAATTRPGLPLVDRDIRRAAIAGCLARFEAFVGTPYAISTLRVSARRPTPDTWAAGDRTVVCSIYDGALTPLTGSMRASRR